MSRFLFSKYIGCLLVCVVTAAGCSVVEYDPLGASASPTHRTSTAKPKADTVKPSGVYHKVKKGETLWMIAQTYQVTLEQIIEGNNIPDAAKIEVDQLILIPGVEQIRSTPVFPSDIVYDDEEFGWPVKGKVISYFNDRKGGDQNRGVDIHASEGAKIKAARSGRVVFADDLNGYGHTVILEHKDGFHTVYARNAKILVGFGSFVRKGEDLAVLGRASENSYLHFEVRKGSVASNPLYYLP